MYSWFYLHHRGCVFVAVCFSSWFRKTFFVKLKSSGVARIVERIRVTGRIREFGLDFSNWPSQLTKLPKDFRRCVLCREAPSGGERSPDVWTEDVNLYWPSHQHCEPAGSLHWNRYRNHAINTCFCSCFSMSCPSPYILQMCYKPKSKRNNNKVVWSTGPIYLIFQFCHYGDLLNYLQNNRECFYKSLTDAFNKDRFSSLYNSYQRKRNSRLKTWDLSGDILNKEE